MIATDYLLPNAASATDLSAFASVLPLQPRVICTNLFGDQFLVAGDGAVHMLDRGGFSADRIAASEEEFWRELAGDAQGWQLRPLADECRRAGKVLAGGQCYAFSTLPVLGGDYTAENVWVASWQEWFSFTADLFQQIDGLPEGAKVTLKVVN